MPRFPFYPALAAMLLLLPAGTYAFTGGSVKAGAKAPTQEASMTAAKLEALWADLGGRTRPGRMRRCCG
jgi:hypothetical protein